MRGELPESEASSSIWILVIRYVACYLIWFLVGGLGLWLIFLFRTNLVEDVLFMRVSGWQVGAIDRWFVYVGGGVWIVVIFLLEGYLRQGAEQGKLIIRSGKVLAIQLTLVALSFLIHAI